MGLILRYVQNTKTGKRYRRRIPDRLRPVLKRTEFTRFLGLTDKEALRAYPSVHAECERLIETAERKLSGKVDESADQAPLTEMDHYRALVASLRALGVDPFKNSFDPDDPKDEAEWNSRSIAADVILDKYPVDPATGDHAGVTRADLALVNALHERAPAAPPPTMEDAKRVYIRDRQLEREGEEKNLQRVNRVVRHVRAALGRDPVLTTFKRIEAREVMAYLLDDAGIGKASTVERYLNDIRAIINHAAREFDLTGFRNPFEGLNPPSTETAREKRKPFTEEQLTKTRDRIMRLASPDLQRIWRILEGTGCRLGEVTGLLVSDLHLEGQRPYLDLVFHDHRRLKTMGSVRRVPLVGDALEAAKEAVSATEAGALLFPAYGRKVRNNNASAALMKHVNACVPDKKVTMHSLRHNMKDRLIAADVPSAVQDMILGHSSGAVSEAYGGPEARLEVAARAMEKALG